MNNIYTNIYFDGINLDLKSKNKSALLKEMYKGLETSPYMLNKEQAFEDLILRESIGTTGIGNSVAIPHAKTEAVSNIIIGIGISKEGIDYESLDDENVKIVFMFLTPIDLSKEYLTILAKISRYTQENKFREDLINAQSKEEVLEIIKNIENS